MKSVYRLPAHLVALEVVVIRAAAIAFAMFGGQPAGPARPAERGTASPVA